MDLNREYLFEGGKITPLRSNVLLIEYTNEFQLSPQHVVYTRELRRKLIGETPYIAIIDIRKGFVKFSKEAKKFIAENQESAKVRLLDILLVSNFGMKIEAVFYLKVFKPKVLTKVVMSIDEAMDEISARQT
jgi:hypothetical protein